MAQGDWKFVTWNTCFHLSLGVGDVSQSCLLVTLRTDPSFLVKNKLPTYSGNNIVIPVLSKYVGNELHDRYLCSVPAFLSLSGLFEADLWQSVSSSFPH